MFFNFSTQTPYISQIFCGSDTETRLASISFVILRRLGRDVQIFFNKGLDNYQLIEYFDLYFFQRFHRI